LKNRSWKKIKSLHLVRKLVEQRGKLRLIVVFRDRMLYKARSVRAITEPDRNERA